MADTPGIASGGTLAAKPARLGTWRGTFTAWQAEIGVGAALIVLIIFCGLLSPNFLSISNFTSLLTQTSVTAIIAVGMTVVMIVGEIDLSVGSTVGLAGSVFAWLIVLAGFPVLVAGAVVLAGAALLGVAIGGLRVVWGIPSFITTIGLLSTLRGCAFLLTGGVTISPLPPAIDTLWYGRLFGVPLPIVLMAVAS
jgi:ribose/xylose/arabinose/galactoside ABC-type transport system permease subunit